MKTVIFVLGMHRSGTSLLAQILQRLGAYLGENDELERANSSNEDGHFEYKKIRIIHDELLTLFDKTWCDSDAFGIDLLLPEIIEYQKKIIHEIDYLLDGHDVVAIKDPRSAFFLQLWEKIFWKKGIEPVYLYEIRNANEVASSLYKRDGISLQYGLRLWKFYNVMIQHYLSNKRHLTLFFNDLFDEVTIKTIANFCGLDEDNCPLVEGVAKEKLRHNMSEDIGGAGDPDIKKIYDKTLSEKELDVLYNEFTFRPYINKTKRLLDIEMMNNNLLAQHDVVIYGAGDYGKRAARMLEELGIQEFSFCDRDINKQGMTIYDIGVESIHELEQKRRLLLIFAIHDDETVKWLTNYFLWLNDVIMCRYVVLKEYWQKQIDSED